jgi:hypothetical protein
MASLVTSIVALVLASINFVVTLLLTLRRDVGAIRPVIVFTYRPEGWHIENLGNGPALDLMFHRRTGETITQSVRLPALAKGTSMCLHFAKRDSKQTFIATYRDADGRRYSSQSRHDLSTSVKGVQVDRPDAGHVLRWWQLPESDS